MLTTETLVARIENLEKTNRRYQRGLLALVLTAAFAIPFIPSDTVAKTAGAKTLVAERLALMSGPKKVGMLLSARGGMNKISMHGPAGKVRMTLSTNAKGQPMISLMDPAQKAKVVVGYSKKKGAHMIMWDSAGKAITKVAK